MAEATEQQQPAAAENEQPASIQPSLSAQSSQGLSIAAVEFVPSSTTTWNSSSDQYNSTDALANDFNQQVYLEGHHNDYDTYGYEDWDYDNVFNSHSEDAFLACLSQSFPEYSLKSLRQVLYDCGGSLSATMDTLASLETELSGQKKAGKPSHPRGNYKAAKAPEFTADDFPSLGGGGSKDGSDSTPAPPPAAPAVSFLGSYAAKARQAPTVAPTDAAAANGVSSNKPAALAAAAAAPVWTQSEGVQRFDTGASVANEYSELRSTARDHARVRNQYFQQATAAYLAGQKALAKELGAKGRYHNDQMKLAHKNAANETFARRNKHTAGGYGKGGNTIDLHGLHVSEALQQLETAINSTASSRGSGTKSLRVVVGVGQHGKVPSRLPAAVKGFLDEKGYIYKEAYEGLLEIKF